MALADEVTSAQIADCTDENALRALGVKNFDLCFVCIGSDFASSLLITSMLKEMGAARVVAKAARDVHAKLLLRNGADEVVYPERDSAERLATRLSARNVFDYIELTDEYSIYEIPPLDSWVGRSVRDVVCETNTTLTFWLSRRMAHSSPCPAAITVSPGGNICSRWRRGRTRRSCCGRFDEIGYILTIYP